MAYGTSLQAVAWKTAPVLLASLVAVWGCGKTRSSPPQAPPIQDPGSTTGSDTVAASCFGCHGDASNGNPAPPRSVRGATATSDAAVGAHQAHLRGGAIRSALPCSECHVVPQGSDRTHIDGKTATLRWGPLAGAQGVTASSATTTGADGARAITCTNYCHGPSVAAGGLVRTPSWTLVDGSQIECGSCHGSPPPGPHPVVAAGVSGCIACHASTVKADGTIDVAGGRHVNGVVDVVVGGGGPGGGGALACTACHGDANRIAVAGSDLDVKAAPPAGTKGEPLPSARAVGAHQVHVNKGAGAISSPIACAECHVTPNLATAHPSGRVDLTFGALATTGGTVPVWSGTTCASTYCHGSFPGGAGSAAAPDWTTVGTLGCSSCHGIPPPASAGHPQNTDCGACHAGYTSTTVVAATHVNGRVDLVGLTCTTCHGTAGRTGPDAHLAAAPPLGTRGETATTSRAIGAHLTHLQGGKNRGPLACSECHVVPTQLIHATGTATVTFGALASRAGASPTWNGSSCSSTYCHGATLAAGGALTTPIWTAVDGAAAACGACHDVPPAPATGHPAVVGGAAGCATCHAATVKPDGTIDVAGGKHINGSLEVAGVGCANCHGDTSRVAVAGADLNVGAAPPRGTRGETLTTDRVVGAHQAHVNKGSGALARPIGCSECHVVPAGTGTHPDGQLNVTFGLVATTGGTVPIWTGTTCASTYCHGAFPGGAGSAAAPSWTTAGALGCTNCHGSPPAASTGHPQNANCGACHVGYTSLTVNVATHVNGVVDHVPLSCTTCHGTPGRAGLDLQIAAAPPLGNAGETATSARAVGAHLAHLQAGNVRTAMPCSECHVVPTQLLHANGSVELAFGPLARTGGASPAWNATGNSCAATYCHGATLAGGARTQPIWTAVDGTQRRCDSCHGAPPAAASGHPTVTGTGTARCAWCHPQTVKSDGTIDLAGGRHVNGTVDVVAQTCTSCHGDASRVLVSGADPAGKAAPPKGAHGETLVTTRAVGAHQAHLDKAAGALAPPTACAECHTVPSDTNGHPSGAVEMTFGALAKTGGLAPAWNGSTCASTYCHGSFRGGAGPSGDPTWTTAGPLGCASCHGNPPPASVGHPQNTSCGSCHAGYTSSSVNLATHVNGRVEVTGAITCTSCHGTPGRTGVDAFVAAAPPLGTRGETATTTRAVGAHLKHLQDGTYRAALACNECHSIPALNIHANGTVELTWGTLARTGNAAPSWNGSSCSSTYCHGSTLNAGGSNHAPTWTVVNGTQATCTTCHDAPPTTGGHPSVAGGLTACNGCHRQTVKPDGTIDVAAGKHVNGTVDVSGVGCTSCHGDVNRAAVAGADSNLPAAPPVGTHAESATTARAVGAHQTHLVAGHVAGPIACNECHVVPGSLLSHPTGTLNVTFGALATTGPTVPLWNGSTCASTYCHGATLGAGGSATAPAWTTVDGSQRQCTSCHDAPPSVASGHPSVASALTGCAVCHPATMKADGTIDVAGGKHVNGSVEASFTCTSCHGDASRTPAAIAPAPPKDTAGLTSSSAVGAHLAHLVGGAIRSAIGCNECHTVPSDSAHSSQPLDLTWGTLARGTGVTPSWVAASLTCTNYCHGASLIGGSDNTPTWNGGSSNAACGTCHGLPPPRAVGASQHPVVSGGQADCYKCHPATMSGTGSSIDTAGGKHVDGAVEVDYTSAAFSCTTCHGDATRVAVSGADVNVKAAPPSGTHGEKATDVPLSRAVGAHLAHVNRGTFAAPIGCAQCHAVPATMSHANGSVGVTWGPLATTGGAIPAWNGSTCASTACHAVVSSRNVASGGTNRTPAWTTGTMSCVSCHGNPPSTGYHSTHQSQSTKCSDCHGAGYTSTFQATGTATGTVNTASHVNGTKEIKAGNPPGATLRSGRWYCTNACHGNSEKGPW